MLKGHITIINKLGLHARAAAKLVSLAAKYSCDISLSNGERMVDAKSIMSVMLLAAAKDTELNIELDGHDEEAAFEAIADLINRRFDEPE